MLCCLVGSARHPRGSSHGREVALLPASPSPAYFKFLQRKNKGLEFALEAKCFLGENGDFPSLQGGFCLLAKISLAAGLLEEHEMG